MRCNVAFAFVLGAGLALLACFENALTPAGFAQQWPDWAQVQQLTGPPVKGLPSSDPGNGAALAASHAEALAAKTGTGGLVPLSKLALAALEGFYRAFNLTEPDHLAGPMVPALEVGSFGTPFLELMMLSFNPDSSQAVQRTLQSTLTGLFVNVDGLRIPAESHWQSCSMLMFATALSLMQGKGDRLVEYGTMMGYSTRCLAAGLEVARPRVPEAVFFAFDRFDYLPLTKSIWKESGFNNKDAIQRLRKPDEYKKQVRRNVLPFEVQLVRGSIGVSKGDVGSGSYWGSRPAGLVAVDSSKDGAFFSNQMTLILPWVQAGSIIVLGDSLMDNAICHQIGSMIGALEHAGYARFMHVAHTTSHTFWEVLKPIPGQLIRKFKFSSLGADTWKELWSSLSLKMRKATAIACGERRAAALQETLARKLKRAELCVQKLP